jgi:glucoamylase
MTRRLWVLTVAATLCAAAPAAATPAPGAPGAVATWTAGDKTGFGTARDLGSKVWFTLEGGELSEVYAPDLGTPSLRDLQFVVTDGRTFTERETDDATSQTRLADPRSLTYRLIDTARSGRGGSPRRS